MDINEIKLKKENNEKISMITCYDYSFAKIIDNTNIDIVLVGDSVSMVMHGFDSTVHANSEMMALHTSAVRRGTNKFIVTDLPFLSNRKSLEYGVSVVEVLVKAGANAVKIEGASGNEKFISHIVESGIPVMGHIGYTPQSVNSFGNKIIQGKDKLSQKKLIEDAKTLEKLGAFAIVLECVENDVAAQITNEIKIPTIGIGAGVSVDGQVLVLQDMLGFNKKFNPKFLKKYFNSNDIFEECIKKYDEEVKNRKFPTMKESYENI